MTLYNIPFTAVCKEKRIGYPDTRTGSGGPLL